LAVVDSDALDALLVETSVIALARARYAEGKAAWPDIELLQAAWREHLLTHVARASGASAHVAALHAADFYLATALVHGDRAAVLAFDKLYIARVREYVFKVSVERHVVDEIAQQLRETLLVGSGEQTCKIADYTGKGALGGWVRVAAVRLALNSKRVKQQAEVSEDVVALGRDPELAYVHAHSEHAFKAAFQAVLATLPIEQRTLLRLHYLQGLTLDQIATMLGGSRSTLGRHLQDARAEILQQTSASLRRDHGFSATAVQSLVRKASSQMQLTFSKLLK
jgi:RNA polymerase sigma-70 factor, ECF subfamily